MATLSPLPLCSVLGLGLLAVPASALADRPPPNTSLGADLAATLDPLAAGQTPVGRHEAFVLVLSSKADRDGLWHSSVVYLDVDLKGGPKVKRWLKDPAGSSPPAAPGRVALTETGIGGEVLGYLLTGYAYRLRLGWDDGGTAVVEADTRGGRIEDLDPVIVFEKTSIPDVAAFVASPTFPGEATETREAYEAELDAKESGPGRRARFYAAELLTVGLRARYVDQHGAVETQLYADEAIPRIRAQLIGGRQPRWDTVALARLLAETGRCTEAAAALDRVGTMGADASWVAESAAICRSAVSAEGAAVRVRLPIGDRLRLDGDASDEPMPAGSTLHRHALLRSIALLRRPPSTYIGRSRCGYAGTVYNEDISLTEMDYAYGTLELVVDRDGSVVEVNPRTSRDVDTVAALKEHGAAYGFSSGGIGGGVRLYIGYTLVDRPHTEATSTNAWAMTPGGPITLTEEVDQYGNVLLDPRPLTVTTWKTTGECSRYIK